VTRNAAECAQSLTRARVPTAKPAVENTGMTAFAEVIVADRATGSRPGMRTVSASEALFAAGFAPVICAGAMGSNAAPVPSWPWM